jgi:hypothetical protein
VQACTLHHDAAHAESLPVRVAMIADVFVHLHGHSVHAKLDAATAEACERLRITPEVRARVLRSLPE